MKILSWRFIPNPGGTASEDATTDKVICRVEFDSIDNPSLYEFLAHPKCPQPYSQHPYYTRPMLLQSYDWSRQAGVGNVFDLTCSFSTKIREGNQTVRDKDLPKLVPDPLKRPAIITVGEAERQEVIEWDVYGNPVVNSAGEPLELVETVAYRVFSIQKNVAKIPKPFLVADNTGRKASHFDVQFTNLDRVRILGRYFGPNELLCVRPQSTPQQFENGNWFYSLTFQLLHNPKTWVRRLRNVGLYEKHVEVDRVTGEEKVSLRRIRHGARSGGREVEVPVPLDEEGKPFRHEDGELMTFRSKQQIGIDADLWARTELKFQTKYRLRFGNTIPLR